MEYTETQTKRYLVIISILLLLLLLLLLLYYFLTRPPQAVLSEAPKKFKVLFTIYGFRGDRLYRPTEVDTDKRGNIYVVDTYKHRIVVFDKNGRFITTFGKAGKKAGELWFPTDIAVADNGNIFVVCKTTNKVVIFGSDYKPRHEIFVESPLGATVVNDRLYITTYRGIMIGDLNGRQMAAFGKRGKAEGQFDFPSAVAVDKKGNIYVADSLNYRIQALNSDGKPLWTVGTPIPAGKAFEPIATKRKFGLPVGLTIDNYGYLYLVDAFTGEIIVFNKNGKEIERYGKWGHDEGQFYYPGGIAYAGGEKFIVADKFNDRIQVLYIPSPAIPPLERAARTYWPYALLLLLLPPLLWALRKRRYMFLTDGAFLEKALTEGKLTLIADSLGKLGVTEEIFEEYKEKEFNGLKLSEILLSIKPKQKLVDEILTRHDVDKESAILLAKSIEKKRRGILLTDKENIKKLAEERNLPSLSYQELIETLTEEKVPSLATE